MAYFYYADKKIYYEEIGRGIPLLLLHGNSVSSKMFQGIIDLYKEDYKVILIDFLGHGRSDRLEQFPTDFGMTRRCRLLSCSPAAAMAESISSAPAEAL